MNLADPYLAHTTPDSTPPLPSAERPTPETDAVLSWPDAGADPFVDADFARRLERERDEARQLAHDEADLRVQWERKAFEAQAERDEAREAMASALRRMDDLLAETSALRVEWPRTAENP